MDHRTYKSTHHNGPYYKDQRRFEHWYRDNQVYFITARCRDKQPSFASESAKKIFWEKFDLYTREAGFTPWVTSLLSNHYHILGYCQAGLKLGAMMRKLHGSVAKLVNDLLPSRHKPFWGDQGHQDYFDGCIRDEKQCRLAYRYTLTQSVRHGICRDWCDYPHTRVNVQLEIALHEAMQLKAFLEGVPYKRYMNGKRR
jgi:hypothetical protein